MFYPLPEDLLFFTRVSVSTFRSSAFRSFRLYQNLCPPYLLERERNVKRGGVRYLRLYENLTPYIGRNKIVTFTLGPFGKSGPVWSGPRMRLGSTWTTSEKRVVNSQ